GIAGKHTRSCTTSYSREAVRDDMGRFLQPLAGMAHLLKVAGNALQGEWQQRFFPRARVFVQKGEDDAADKLFLLQEFLEPLRGMISIGCVHSADDGRFNRGRARKAEA